MGQCQEIVYPLAEDDDGTEPRLLGVPLDLHHPARLHLLHHLRVLLGHSPSLIQL